MNVFTSYPHSPYKSKKISGFTIVELLIVIVVIAILAAISIVGYNGIQQRANNAATINAVSQSIRVIQAYIATNGRSPASAKWSIECITFDSGCTDERAVVRKEFNDEIATIGTLPRSVSSKAGITLWNNDDIVVDGKKQPLMITYRLTGINQQCSMSGVVAGTWPKCSMSTTGYTNGNNDAGAGKETACWISIPL